MKFWSKKNMLDEMQEQKLRRIESNGFWFAFWALFVVMVVETIWFRDNLQVAAGEWLVFMCLALYMGGACARNGLWDRHLKLNLTTCLVTSVIAGAFMMVFTFVRTYLGYHKPAGSVAAGIWSGGFTFTISLIAMLLISRYTKKRQEKLEEEPEEEILR